MLSKVIPAVDTADRTEVMKLMINEGDCEIIKINYEIALEGLNIIPLIKQLGHKIFLDLKLYDIPNTMTRVCKRLNHYDVDFITVHGEAPKESIKAAVDTFNGKVLVVCGLTSYRTNTSSLIFFAKKAVDAGAYGIISNAIQVVNIKKQFPNIVAFCPGIRVNNILNDDQVVKVHPKTAFENGADYIICGRSFNEVKQYYNEA